MHRLPDSGNLFNEAIQDALLIEDPAAAANAKLEISRALRRVGNVDFAKALLPGLLLDIRNLDDPRERAYLLRLFIEFQCDVAALEEALETVKLLDFDPDQRQAALTSLAVALAAAGRFDEAYRLADDIEELGDFETVLEAAGVRLADEGRFPEALEKAEEIETVETRIRLLRGMYSRNSQTELLHQAAALARDIDDKTTRCGVLAELILSCTCTNAPPIPPFATELLDEAAYLLQNIDDEYHLATLRWKLGTAMFRLKRVDAATDYFRGALASIRKLPNDYVRALMLSFSALDLAEMAQTEPARRVFRLAVEAAREIEDPAFRLERLTEIIRNQAEASFVDDAMETFHLLEELPASTRDGVLAEGGVGVKGIHKAWVIGGYADVLMVDSGP